MGAVRVLIAGSSATVRSGLRLALEAAGGIGPVDEAETVGRALAEAGTTKPDVILLEDRALELVPTMLNEIPNAKIVVLGTQDEPQSVQEAFAAGASGYLLVDNAAREAVAAVGEVAAGGRYVNPELGARLMAVEARARRRAEGDRLSEREHEVLRLLALGHTNQEIAKQLVISVRTAETHRAHIMEKLGLSSRAELVRYALDRGLLQDEAQ
jgi:two-component system, NarL family, response regulator NreC